MPAEVRGIHSAAKKEARRALKEALAADLKEVIVLGIYPNGDIYSDATDGDCYRILWLLENYKHELMVAAKEERQEGAT